MRFSKKFAAISIVAASALAAGAAFAFWTAEGGGNGIASVRRRQWHQHHRHHLHWRPVPDGEVPVSFTINNLSANTAVQVDKVVADQGTLDDQGTADPSDDSWAWPNGIGGLSGSCSPADFHFADVQLTTAQGHIVASGSFTGSGALSMDETTSNQDDCKNASPVLHLKVDNSGI